MVFASTQILVDIVHKRFKMHRYAWMFLLENVRLFCLLVDAQRSLPSVKIEIVIHTHI